MGRILAAIAIAFVLFVILGASGGIQWFSDILRVIPAPTEHWASIIGDVVWPMTIAWLIVRFRHSLRRVIEILIMRFKRDDIDIANVLKVTRNSQLVALASDDQAGTPDATTTEHLLEYISDTANVPTLNDWLNQNGRGELNIREFITQPEYADLRQRAHQHLIEGGNHG